MIARIALNRWQLEKNNQVLCVLSISMILLIMVMAVTLMFAVKVRGPYQSQEILEDFSNRISRHAFAFDPKSFDGQIRQIEPYLRDGVTENLKASFEENREIMATHQIRQEFEIEDYKVKEGRNPFLLELTGVQKTYSEDHPDTVNESPVRYLFEIEAVKPSRDNPYGLKLARIHKYPKNEVVQP